MNEFIKENKMEIIALTVVYITGLVLLRLPKSNHSFDMN